MIGFVPEFGFSFLCTGTVISRFHVLTAGHCLDIDNDGQIDLDPANIHFFLNLAPTSTLVSQPTELLIHPDFTGFANPSINDDLAILKFDTPFPDEVPV